MDLYDLQGLSGKTANTLRRYGGITTVEELRGRSAEELLKITRVGDATLREIEAALAQIKVSSVEPWPEDEVSTRNCFNAKVKIGTEVLAGLRDELTDKNVDVLRVYCAKGGKLLKRYSSVVKSKTLYSPCVGCTNFDNGWE